MSLPYRTEESLDEETLSNIKKVLDRYDITYRKNAKKESLIKTYLHNMVQEDVQEEPEDEIPEDTGLPYKSKSELSKMSREEIKDLLVNAGLIRSTNKQRVEILRDLYLKSLTEGSSDEEPVEEKKSSKKKPSPGKKVVWAGDSSRLENVAVEYIKDDDWQDYLRLKNELKTNYRLNKEDAKYFEELQSLKDDEELDPVCFTTGTTKESAEYNNDEHNVVRFTVGDEKWSFYGIYSGGETSRMARIVMTALPSALGSELKKIHHEKDKKAAIQRAIKEVYENVNKSLPNFTDRADVVALLMGESNSYFINLNKGYFGGFDKNPSRKISPQITIYPSKETQKVVLATQTVWKEIADVKDSFLEVLACECLLELVLRRFKLRGIEDDATIMMVTLKR